MSLRVNINMQHTVVDTGEGEFVAPENNTNTVNRLNFTTELTGSTVPPATKQTAGRATLVAGAVSIDLTSLPDAFSGAAGAVNFTGLKVNSYHFYNPGANDIVITFGAANPYLLRGTAFKLTLRPGERDQWAGADLGPDVAAGAKQIDVTGTGTQFLEFHMTAG